MALYSATGGERWKHRVGWGGPAGTECQWHGVDCWQHPGSSQLRWAVYRLDLGGDGLRGTIPDAVADGLPNLESVDVSANELDGLLPRKWIDRYLDDGRFSLHADIEQLTETNLVEQSVNFVGLLCGWEQWLLSRDGTARSYRTACRNRTPEDRETYCEVRAGRLHQWYFIQLAWLLERSGFSRVARDYSRSVTHGTKVDTTVRGARGDHTLSNYADGAPLAVWGLQAAVEGVIRRVEWETTEEARVCPGRWLME
jgi:hypothetical protein